MLAAEAQQEFERFLAASGARVVDLDVPSAVEAMLAFYAGVRAEDCDLDQDGDMLLYQWGTYDRGEGPRFELNLTRQLMIDGSDDDEIWQLSLTFQLAVHPAVPALELESSRAYATASGAPILAISLTHELVG